jgi:hypothetical protein
MIKKVIRFELPETNSSSSHSVIISELKNNKNDLKIEDGIIYIPDPSEGEFNFGRTGFQAFNDSLSKIVFTIAIYNSTHELEEVLKFLNNLKYIICKYTGATNVVFKSIDKFNSVSRNLDDRDISSKEDLDDTIWEICDIAFGNVDHESTDLIDEILENRDSLKNFIFSEDSWLFLGDDGVDMETQISDTLKSYYNLEQEDDNYATIDFSKYGIGKVDIELPNLFIGDDFINNLLYKKEGFLSNILFDNINKKLVMRGNYHSYGYYPDKNRLLVYTVPVGDKKDLKNVNTIVSHNGKLYIYMINSIFYDSASGYLISYKNDLSFEELGDCFLDIIEKYNLIEEKDWIRFELEINTKEFGKL